MAFFYLTEEVQLPFVILFPRRSLQKLYYRGSRNPDLDAETSVMVLGVLERQVINYGHSCGHTKLKQLPCWELGRSFTYVFPKYR